MRRADSRSARATAAVLVLTLLPVPLLAAFAIKLSSDVVRDQVRSRVRATGVVGVTFVQQQLTALTDLTAFYAAEPVVRTATAGGGATDRQLLTAEMRRLAGSRANIAVAFTADADGRVTSVYPPNPAVIGADFSFRDWYRGARSTGRAYVSEAYESAVAGRPRVIGIAAPVRDAQGAIRGYVIVGYGVQAFQQFVDRFSAQQVWLTVTDQRGVVIGAPGVPAAALPSRRQDPRVAAALAGRSGTRDVGSGSGSVLSSYLPVPGPDWVVLADVPTRAAYASVRRLRTAMLGAATILEALLLAGCGGYLRSRSRRARAENAARLAEERMRDIVDAAYDPFVAMDQDGRITGWNKQAEVTFGWAAEEAVGRTVRDTIVPPDQRATHEAGLARHLAGGPSAILDRRIDVRAVNRAGTEFPVELAVWQADEDTAGGEGRTFNAFIRDISERVAAADELRAARDQAVEASRLKSEFLATMSHEIRTPMNGVLGMASLLEAAQLTEGERRQLQLLTESGQNLLVVINDILDFSKIEAGKLTLESVPFDLPALTQSVVVSFERVAQDKRLVLAVELDSDVPVWVSGDPGRSRQVLTNLVGNAVKFTERGGVSVRVSLRDGHCRWEVIDTGIGIAESTRSSLLEPFSQADASTTRRFGGTGLGLAICRDLVELMNGTFGFDSEHGRGSTFWFELPLPAASATAQSSPDPAAAATTPLAGSGVRVLVVDDGVVNQEVARGMLERLGHQVTLVDSGLQALDALQVGGFDVVLMDCQMPGMDGYETTRQLRQREGPDLHVPVVALTASAMSGDRERCLDAGMDDYLSKPMELTELSAAIARWSGISSAGTGGSGAPEKATAAADPDRDVALEQGLDKLAAQVGPSGFTRVAEVFLVSIPQRLASLRESIEAGDVEAIRGTAHSLVGSAAGLGALQLSEYARAVEMGALDGKALSGELRSLDDEYARVQTAVLRRLAST